MKKYFNKELENNAVLGPFQSNPFANKAYLSPLNIWDKKDSEEKKIIVDMSFPKGNSINDGIKKDFYLDEQICLKYPTVDKLVEIVKKKGKGCMLFKRDLCRFYRQIPVCPKDYNKLGVIFEDQWYFDRVLVMGCRSSCYLAQRITNALKYILQGMMVETENYLDDLGGAEVPDLAEESFRKMGNLPIYLNIEESVSKVCGPGTRMIFLGIIVDTIKMTLELDENRLSELHNLLEDWGHKMHASLKQVQSLVGVLSFASSCIRQGRPFFSRVLNFLCELPAKGRTTIPNEVRKDISWWKEIAPLYNGLSCILVDFWSKPDSLISTDACLLGGGYFNGKYFHFDFSEALIARGKYINQFELFVLWKALELWGAKLRRKNILIYCDNKTTVDCLRSGISRSTFSQAYIRNILHFAAVNDFQIRAVHINGCTNHLSDCLSRWTLNEKYQKEFHRLTEGIDTVKIEVKDTKFSDLY